ncbi:MAG: dTDP-4-dehydrorhamnose reductase [Betaproteobacteria bacterium]|nr:dTDP-4-dehydrorhamnose reductase [Betaproteobacteria bacterium]
MTRILLVGAGGQVGWELRRTLAPLGEVIAPGRRELDLGDPDSVRSAVRQARPGLIVNAAAYTAVDRAESDPALAMAVNGTAPGILAEEAGRLDASLVHYSTDYVFDGTKPAAYSEEDAPNPLSVYGASKLAGEKAVQAAGISHLIFRTSWVYGGRGRNFLLTILRLAQERSELNIVDDQIGAPTWSRMIAEATAQILAQSARRVGERSGHLEQAGLFHLTAGGQTSWYGFTRAILDQVFPGTGPASASREPPRLNPIPAAMYPAAAARPKNSVLSNARLLAEFGIGLPHWSDCLKMCLSDMEQQ